MLKLASFFSVFRCLGVLLLLVWHGAWAAEALQLRRDGADAATLSRGQMAERVGTAKLALLNPTTGRRAEYLGAPLKDLLSAVFGETWRRYDEITFVCADGYRPSLPLSLLDRHKALLAYGQPGRDGFDPIVRANGQTVDPGPYYLVWDTDHDADLAADGWVSWPWQVVAIELARGGELYPKAAPPADSGEAVRRGFLAFSQHCIKCHAVNGDGARVGPELNYPASVTEYWRPEWLERFILDPSSVRHGATMAAFYAGLPQRRERVAEVLAYLRTMAAHKRAPEKSVKYLSPPNSELDHE